MAQNTWTADRRLYLNAEGQAVEADDPSRVSLLIGVGQTLPLEEAQRLGLVTVEGEQTITTVAPKTNEKGRQPAQNKARTPAQNKGKE